MSTPNLSLSGTPEEKRFVAESSLDFLIMEMVQLMQRSPVEAENDKEAAYFKLEALGYRVGMALVERFTKDRPRFIDNLDVVKFICKELWITVFKKQIDNLKTNHRGVYVLTDNNFRWFMRMSSDGGSAETSRQAFPYLAFPCGLIRGALANLGVVTVVIAEVTSIPSCTFQIKISKT
ncbi:transport protein particle component, Bet3 family protein [Blyttiomyces helicus]|uniref:Transport protein particle component, Bet3 family protein n=1 Tax=Blyttiomyces helicus TaxID=388810 RepID=A0A4P9WQU2_9FUNG|nr:transport protein particle component, Bet3 family protein [Blyttiomyces helicus]|eukprot:RKO94198.1 transport protein particle component, Bet3 family protein [Blyttiomyces helicus]